MAAFETYTLDGCKVEYFYDQDSPAPWESEDGHGPVRFMRNNTGFTRSGDKRPGECILSEDRGGKWLYDWQAACAKAKAEGWDAEPYGEPGQIERAVRADFNHLRDYLHQSWYYIGITVTLGDKQESLWGVEYDYPYDHAKEIVRDMIDTLHADAKVEADEAFYWACRDVVTV